MKTTQQQQSAHASLAPGSSNRLIPRLRALALTAAAALALVLAPAASAAAPTFQVLHHLDYSTTGGYPFAGLVQGTDGALYGTTYDGGSSGQGTAFRLSFGPPAAPDLEVLTLTTTNIKAPQGQKVTITAVVKNTGNAAAGASTTVIRDGATVLATVATPALGAGDSVTLTLDLRTAAQNGTHVLSVTADTANTVAESNETNNTKPLTVNIKGNQVR